MGRKPKQLKRARAAAVTAFGRTDGMPPEEVKEMQVKKAHGTFSGKRLDRIMTAIATQKRTPGGLVCPPGTHAVDIDTIYSLYKVATRDNDELPGVYCPKCKEVHYEQVMIRCPIHGEEYPLLFPKIPAEKNSIAAAKILADKRFAQKQLITGNLEVKSVSIVMIKQLVGVVQKYVPKEDMGKAKMEIDNILEEMARLEVED